MRFGCLLPGVRVVALAVGLRIRRFLPRARIVAVGRRRRVSGSILLLFVGHFVVGTVLGRSLRFLGNSLRFLGNSLRFLGNSLRFLGSSLWFLGNGFRFGFSGGFASGIDIGRFTGILASRPHLMLETRKRRAGKEFTVEVDRPGCIIIAGDQEGYAVR